MSGLRFIIVEDERIVAHDLATQITSLGSSVLGIAGDAEAAVRLAEETRPDIVLMDIRLGVDRDGISAAQEIRERLDIPPIFVTAYTDDDTLRRAERVQPLGYIVKPFRTHELKATLLMAAAQQRLTRASDESRAWLAAVLASLGDGVIALDALNRITLANPAAERLLQRSSSSMLGRNVGEVLETAGWQGLPPPGVALNVKVQSRDGRERAIEISSASVSFKREVSSGTVVVLRDVTDRIIAANLVQRERDFMARRVSLTGAELERTKDELHALATSMLTAQEDERRRIAREIHDDLAQRAAALEMKVAGIESQTAGGAEVGGQLTELRESIRELSDSLRVLSHDLHPSILEDLGLEIGLRRYVEQFGQRENISVVFRATRLPSSLPPAVASGIYRIAQEALRNVAKHSESPVASVSLACVQGQLRLSVRDCGKGFDPAGVRYAQGLGLISMQERSRALSGTLAVFSKAGAGTLLVLRVPMTCGSA